MGIFIMKEEEIKIIKELIDNDTDIKRCCDYYYKISNGDYVCVNDALKFTNDKYHELCLTDADIVLANKIVSISNPPDSDLIKRVIANLNCIYDLLIARIIKQLFIK